ncbi:MAG TPA: hypothetical protein VGH01_01200, partial [Jatrophihabitantaceae bacterium]
SDVTINELAQLVAQTVGFDGTIEHDTTKPDGTPQKLLDVSKINALGWKAQIALADGLATTYEWYRGQTTVRG